MHKFLVTGTPFHQSLIHDQHAAPLPTRTLSIKHVQNVSLASKIFLVAFRRIDLNFNAFP